jgi:hypothetical protein
VARAVKVQFVADDGVPVIAPALDSVKPQGARLPTAISQMIGVSPLAARVCEYGTPTVPFGSEDVVIEGGVPPVGKVQTLEGQVRVCTALSAPTGTLLASRY